VSRRIPLPIRLSAIALVVGSLLRADDPPALTPPPGYKVVYHDNGSGQKVPIFVKNQADISSAVRRYGDDPLDPQKVFSETNAAQNKTFNSGNIDTNKPADLGSQKTFATKVYGDTGPNSVYNLGSKSTYHTASYDGTKAAPGYNQAYATKDAPTDLNHADSQFAPIGSSDQNRTAPIDAKTYATFAAPDSNKDFSGPEADALHRHAKPGEHIDGDMQVIGEIPDRPLSVDEVRALINHGFKPNLDQPPEPASKPLNDPNYQPEPLRIEPTSPDDALPVPPATGMRKVQDDDANDPVPSPGTMAEHPEDNQPLPSK
jgi:hypothetical protein